jgi:hypothetical protein
MTRITDHVLGIPSQCVQTKNVQRCNPQLMANILLKVNSKLGGSNCSMPRELPFVEQVPTIVFGADVSHPGPGGGAAIKASMNVKMFNLINEFVAIHLRRCCLYGSSIEPLCLYR